MKNTHSEFNNPVVRTAEVSINPSLRAIARAALRPGEANTYFRPVFDPARLYASPTPAPSQLSGRFLSNRIKSRVMSTGAGWEREVADYLRSHGYKARTRYIVGSHEIDVYATRAEEALIIECKDWSRAVSKDPVRTVHNNAEEIGGTPGLAYTSEMTDGATQLANQYGVVMFSAGVIRGEVLNLEEIKHIARAHSISLPDASDLSDLDDPIGPFVIGSTFAERVAEQAQRDAFEVTSHQTDALKRDVQRLIDETDEPSCVPILRNDRGRIDLYFIGNKSHDALPRPIKKRSLSFR